MSSSQNTLSTSDYRNLSDQEKLLNEHSQQLNTLMVVSPLFKGHQKDIFARVLDPNIYSAIGHYHSQWKDRVEYANCSLAWYIVKDDTWNKTSRLMDDLEDSLTDRQSALDELEDSLTDGQSKKKLHATLSRDFQGGCRQSDETS